MCSCVRRCPCDGVPACDGIPACNGASGSSPSPWYVFGSPLACLPDLHGVVSQYMQPLPCVVQTPLPSLSHGVPTLYQPHLWYIQPPFPMVSQLLPPPLVLPAHAAPPPNLPLCHVLPTSSSILLVSCCRWRVMRRS